MNEDIVTLEDVWAQYNGIPVLEGISLSIQQNDFLGIIGPNGGGKTTLLKIILGLITPNRGTVSVFGVRGGPGCEPGFPGGTELVAFPRLPLSSPVIVSRWTAGGR